MATINGHKCQGGDRKKVTSLEIRTFNEMENSKGQETGNTVLINAVQLAVINITSYV